MDLFSEEVNTLYPFTQLWLSKVVVYTPRHTHSNKATFMRQNFEKGKKSFMSSTIYHVDGWVIQSSQR